MLCRSGSESRFSNMADLYNRYRDSDTCTTFFVRTIKKSNQTKCGDFRLLFFVKEFPHWMKTNFLTCPKEFLCKWLAINLFGTFLKESSYRRLYVCPYGCLKLNILQLDYFIETFLVSFFLDKFKQNNNIFHLTGVSNSLSNDFNMIGKFFNIKLHEKVQKG